MLIQLGKIVFIVVFLDKFTIKIDDMDISTKDQQLLAILTENARCPVSEIARRMSVSRTAAQMRLQKLERNGVIEGYGVRYSPAYQKNQVRALVMIKSPLYLLGSILISSLSSATKIPGKFT